jgi:hypothetical protein
MSSPPERTLPVLFAYNVLFEFTLSTLLQIFTLAPPTIGNFRAYLYTIVARGFFVTLAVTIATRTLKSFNLGHTPAKPNQPPSLYHTFQNR